MANAPDVAIGAPILPRLVYPKIAIVAFDKMHRTVFRVATLGGQLMADVLRYAYHIVHHLFGMAENVFVDALHDKAFAVFTAYDICIVDMSLILLANRNNLGAKMEMLGYFFDVHNR